MATYKIKSPDGRVVTLRGESPPSDEELDGIFSSIPAKPKGLQDNPIYQAFDEYGKAGISNAQGLFEGATAGIPREVLNKMTGYEIPKGSVVGRVAGTILGPGKLAGMATKGVKAFQGANIASKIAKAATEGVITGALAPRDDALNISGRLKDAISGGALNAALSGGGSYLQKPATEAAIRIAQNFLKPGGRFLKKSKNIAENALKFDVLKGSVSDTQQAAQSQIDDLMNQVDELADTSTGTINTKPVETRVKALSRWFKNRGASDKAAKAESVLEDVLKGEGLTEDILGQVPGKSGIMGQAPQTVVVGKRFKDVTPKRALSVRRKQDELLKKMKVGGGYNADTNSAEVETRQEVTGALRKAIGKLIPGIKDRNRDISKLIDIFSVAKGRSGVSSRNNVFDLADNVMATGAFANPKTLALLLGKKIYQGGKSSIAKNLYKFGKSQSTLPSEFGALIPYLAEASRQSQDN